jgi:tripartite-type tricarboxylate transporter receptor subunit TctC
MDQQDQMKTTSVLWFVLIGLCAMCLSPITAMAEDWPPNLTRIEVPYGTGTSPDILARLLAVRLATLTGKSFIVENRPGANAVIGTNYAAKAPADGSVLLLADRVAIGANPFLYKPLPYDFRRAFASVTEIGDVRMYLMVTADFPVNTYREFVAYAKAHPGKLIFGRAGIGHISYLDEAALQAGAGIQVLDVPYKGMGDVITAQLSGTVQATINGIEAVQALVKEGKIRLLAVGAPTRQALTPDVPTITEAGGTEDMLMPAGFSLHVPAGTPAATVQKINETVNAVLADPKVVSFTKQIGLDVHGSTPQALDQLMDQDTKELTKLVQTLGIAAK